MTYDLVLLLAKMPAEEDLLAALGAAGMELGVRAVSGAAVIQLCDDGGDPLVSIDTPMYAQVPGEVERLLGPGMRNVPTPVWWVELRAASREAAARQIAWRYADALVDRLGGQISGPPPDQPALRLAGPADD